MSDSESESDPGQPTREELDDAFGALEEQTGRVGQDGDSSDEDRPDPSDLEPITKAEAEYQRDADGNLKPNYHPVQYGGEWRRVGVKPLLPTDAIKLEQQFEGRGDIDFEELHPVLDDHIVEPADVDWAYGKIEVIMPCLMALMDETNGDVDSEFYEDVEAELKKRSDSGAGGTEGN